LSFDRDRASFSDSSCSKSSTAPRPRHSNTSSESPAPPTDEILLVEEDGPSDASEPLLLELDDNPASRLLLASVQLSSSPPRSPSSSDLDLDECVLVESDESSPTRRDGGEEGGENERNEVDEGVESNEGEGGPGEVRWLAKGWDERARGTICTRCIGGGVDRWNGFCVAKKGGLPVPCVVQLGRLQRGRRG
jgi:hypothetical protein